MANQAQEATLSAGTKASKKWQNDRFINISIKNAKGKLIQFGNIPLSLNNSVHAKLIEQLDADPEAVDRLMSKVEVTYRDATPVDHEFDI